MSTQQVQTDESDLQKFHERIKKGAIVKAIRGWKKSNIPFNLIEPDLLIAIESAFKKKQPGIILSAYYELGQFGSYSTPVLLDLLFEQKDFPTFLKQAYRFGIYEGFEQKIETAVAWHEQKKLNDAFAWKLKFEKLKEIFIFEKSSIESSQSENTNSSNTLRIVDEEASQKNKSFIYLELTPIKRKKNNIIKKTVEEVEQQPYILSLVSKKKLENANQKHSSTLEILKQELNSKGYNVTETRHIDAFAIIQDTPAIFEIKSINEENENDQVRAAISQLYEYRFMYSLPSATLWLVFSEKPFSDWIVEYLTQDRGIGVLWVENNKIAGTSLKNLR